MEKNQISVLRVMVDLQMAAEANFGIDPRQSNSVLRPGQSIDTPEIPVVRLVDGNNRSSLFPTKIAEAFSNRFQLIEHKSNTETGFSGTLFRYIGPNDEASGLKTGDKILSFRSTEFIDDAVRENQATNKGEIQDKGWAFGQIADMQSWYEQLSADAVKLGTGGQYYVTGYSLGGHLATAFRLMRQADGSAGRINATYTFNGAGVGDVLNAGDAFTTGRRLLEITNRFRSESSVDFLAAGNVRGSSLSFSNTRVAALYGELRDIFNQRIGSFRDVAALQGVMSQVVSTFNRWFPGSMVRSVSTLPLNSILLDEATLKDGGERLNPASIGEVRQVVESILRIREILLEGERLTRVTNSGTPPAEVPPYQVAAMRLDYQMAVLNAAKSTSSYRTSALSAGKDGLSLDTAAVKQVLANVFDVTGATEPSSVAKSQWHYGVPVRPFIEDQPLSRGNVAWETLTQSLLYWDTKLLGDDFAKNDFGDTHSLVLMVDSLSVGAALATLDPTLTLDRMNTLFRTASNKKRSLPGLDRKSVG